MDPETEPALRDATAGDAEAITEIYNESIRAGDACANASAPPPRARGRLSHAPTSVPKKAALPATKAIFTHSSAKAMLIHSATVTPPS